MNSLAAISLVVGALVGLGMIAAHRRPTTSINAAAVAASPPSAPTITRVPSDLHHVAASLPPEPAPSTERFTALGKTLQELHATAPESARQLMLALEPPDRIEVASRALRFATGQSAEAAVREAIALCDDDPPYALEYGRALIASLAEAGEHAAALPFILAEDNADGWLGENPHKWITTLFTSWARSAPAEAARAARESVSANYRDEALQVVAATLDARSQN